MKLTYLGTATLALRIGETSLLTDPVFAAAGTTYDFGPWFVPRSWFASEKTYRTPAEPSTLGRFDGVLLSHDHHADNLDFAGRKLIADPARVARVFTTPASARRLARPAAAVDAPGKGLGLTDRAVALGPSDAVRVGSVTIRATVARHGPFYAPRADEVTGFLLDVDAGPRIWISGDTVMFPALHRALEEIARDRPVDVAVVHCGAVGFPRALGFGHARFTFDAEEAVAACRTLNAGLIVPVHRSGWAHFRQPETELMDAFDRAGLANRTRVLALGDSLEL